MYILNKNIKIYNSCDFNYVSSSVFVNINMVNFSITYSYTQKSGFIPCLNYYCSRYNTMNKHFDIYVGILYSRN